MDLSTTYLGLELPHPFVAGASPLADTTDNVRRAEDAGAAAIVLRSLFEEQIRAEALATQAATETPGESFGEALSYLPDPEEFVVGPEEYLRHIRKIKDAVDVPVIASLNGTTPGGWLDYARLMAEAGADALELNLYDVVTDPTQSGASIEQRSVEVVASVKQGVKIPVAVKLSPFYTSFAHVAQRLTEVGADGLVLFNRYFEPDIDAEELEVISQLRLSKSSELLLRLRWLAILSARLDTSLAVTGGVHTAGDAVKAVMCGAHAIQLVSTLLINGVDNIKSIRTQFGEWLEKHEYESLAQMRGSMNLDRCPSPNAYARANYIRQLQTWEGV